MAALPASGDRLLAAISDTGAPARRTLANALRVLAMDAVQRAASGHPGMPMGMADIAEVLWNDYLSHNPANPAWPDRDRFVLSNGHGSMLLYALLHLSGYALPMEQLQNFRQLGSATPGHPEYGHTPGVETTTGPLGQGLANAVGMALAERILAHRFNRDQRIVDHRTWAFVGDGCLMEGISQEAISLAGVLGLGKLCLFYDDNGISIDGPVAEWFGDDSAARFRACNWHVVADVDGHDSRQIAAAIEEAMVEELRPSLICCKTVIGWGAPDVQGDASTHGAPLGDAQIAAAREHLGWPHPPFEMPQQIAAAWDARGRGAEAEAAWNERHEEWRLDNPQLAEEWQRRVAGKLPDHFDQMTGQYIAECQAQQPKVATRKASRQVLDTWAPRLPELVGGSADLSGSNLTLWQGAQAVRPGDLDGNYIHYGVREFAMTAMANGMALHGGLLPFVGTFLVFMDYARNAVRLAALMRQRLVLVYTHDSIGLGEDGPTHQPVEHLASLRAMPGIATWRPCDAVETAVAWREALMASGPSALALSRQSLPCQSRDGAQLQAVARGGYVLRDCNGPPRAIIMASGSEVELALAAQDALAEQGVAARVLSMPCMERFLAQDRQWRDEVLPPSVRARVAVEAGSSQSWHRLVGLDGAILGLDEFGASGPGDALMGHFGFTPERVVALVRGLVNK